MAGSTNGYGAHLAALVTGGARGRIGPSDELGADRDPAPHAGTNTDGEATDAAAAAEDAAGSAASQPGQAPLSSRQGAIDAYCLELCGAARMRIAAEEVICSLRLSAPVAVVSEQELISVTRATASGFAPQVLSAGSTARGVRGPQPECGFTLPRLARRANGDLDGVSQAALTEHLAACIVCRAAQARHERAERAYAVVIGAVAPPLLEEPAEPVVLATPEPPVAPRPPEPGPEPVVEPEPLEPPPLVPESVVVPEQPAHDGSAVSAAARRSPLRGWRVLIGTLVLGAIVVVLIAVLASSGPSGPDPRSLPPAAVAAPAPGAATRSIGSTLT